MAHLSCREEPEKEALGRGRERSTSYLICAYAGGRQFRLQRKSTLSLVMTGMSPEDIVLSEVKPGTEKQVPKGLIYM